VRPDLPVGANVDDPPGASRSERDEAYRNRRRLERPRAASEGAQNIPAQTFEAGRLATPPIVGLPDPSADKRATGRVNHDEDRKHYRDRSRRFASRGRRRGDRPSKTWVSGASSAVDSNACTRAAPCATFAGAYAKTSAGGEIDVLDGGEFGPLTINNAVTIANDGVGTAAITVFAVAIVVSAGPTDVVLRGVTLNGTTSGNDGIIFNSGGSLLVDRCKIQNLAPSRGSCSSPTAARRCGLRTRCCRIVAQAV
jgi:hypothetical protein